MSYEKYFDILHFPNLQKVIVHLPEHKGCYLIRVEDNCMAAVGTGEVLLLVAHLLGNAKTFTNGTYMNSIKIYAILCQLMHLIWKWVHFLILMHPNWLILIQNDTFEEIHYWNNSFAKITFTSLHLVYIYFQKSLMKMFSLNPVRKSTSSCTHYNKTHDHFFW